MKLSKTEKANIKKAIKLIDSRYISCAVCALAYVGSSHWIEIEEMSPDADHFSLEKNPEAGVLMLLTFAEVCG